ERRFYLAKPRRQNSGFMRDRQRIQGRLLQQRLDPRPELRFDPDRALEGARKYLSPDRLVNGLPRRRDPYAAARQLALEIGNHLTFRTDHEADHLADRL